MRIVILLLISFLLCNHVHGQASTSIVRTSDDSNRWKRGFIVNLRGDTVRGRVKIPDFLDVYYDFQRKLHFRDMKGTTASYIPDELTSFSYFDDQDTLTQFVTLESRSSPDGDGRMFMKLYCNGTCKVYGYTITEMKGENKSAGTEMTRSSLWPMEKKFIQLHNSDFFPLRLIGFKRAMKEFFSECPIILARLDSKAYTYSNWRAMVKDYNCGVCK